MAPQTRHERRTVRSEDPSLSPRANRLLTDELREVIGSREVEVPVGTPHRAGERHATRTQSGSSFFNVRIGLVVAAFALLVVGIIVSLVTGSWWALVAALAVHAIGTLVVAGTALQATTEAEHVPPGVAADLESEGVADPDAVFSDLLEEFSGAERAHGTAEVIGTGNNELTVDPQHDPARAGVEQRTAMTPSSEPGSPAGSRSPLAALSWYVVLTMMAASIVAAALTGGLAWIAPVIVVPLGVAWMLFERRIDGRREERAGHSGRYAQPGIARAPGDGAAAARRRLAPLVAVVVAGVVAFAIVLGIMIDAI